MSQTPNRIGAKKLRELGLRYLHANADAIAEGVKRDAAVKRLAAATETLDMTRKEIVQLLEDMDCAGKGNFGWDYRIACLLSMLVSPDPSAIVAAQQEKP